MGWIRCVGCEKLQRDFVARTFALIEPVQYVLQQVSCSYRTIPNAPKYYKTDRNISLGSNGVDWVRSLRKILNWLRGSNFCINCTSSPRFAPSFMHLRNEPKCTQTLWNTPKHECRVQCEDWVRSLQKIPTWLCCTNFCINCTSSVCFVPSFMQLRNDPKCTQTLWNAPMGWIRFVCWEKNTMWLRGTNFCINCTSSVSFVLSFMQLRNDPKCTQILQNISKHYFRVQWGGSGACIVKNPDVTS
jgi:hypothetical protein